MGQIAFRKRSFFGWLLIIFLSLAWAGCSTTVKERQQGQPVTEATGEINTEGVGMGKYYLDDVLVPSELNYQPNKSFVYETSRFKAGILNFSKWRLDVPSLIEFFIYNLEKENWKLINSFKGKESVLNFSKPDKTCMVKITENWYGMTKVEIRVGPLGEKKM